MYPVLDVLVPASPGSDKDYEGEKGYTIRVPLCIYDLLCFVDVEHACSDVSENNLVTHSIHLFPLYDNYQYIL